MNPLARIIASLRPEAKAKPLRHRRFLSGRAGEGSRFLEAAREYVANKSGGELAWLYQKPYDRSPGNPTFFTEMYQVLNLLQAMAIRPYGRVLEVGSGPGWVTEILALLGYNVDAIEPTRDMIDIAQRRIACAFECYKLSGPPEVRFHEATLEDCSLPDESFDAVLFHEALHHVVDEEKGLARCFQLLRPGGVLGVSEWAWIPGDRQLEEQLEEEIARFGTLESPYTQEYLDHLLTRHGFVQVQRYHAVNGLFRREDGRRTLEEAAQIPAGASNNLTARKPGGLFATSADFDKKTLAKITILDYLMTGDAVKAVVALTNTGETSWLAGGSAPGSVNIALRSGTPGEPGFLEAEPRQRLPEMVPPGKSITSTLEYTLPAGCRDRRWEVDLVSERLFWFSMRGTIPAALPVSQRGS